MHNSPDSKVHGANMGPIWGQQDPGGPHGGFMNFTIWVPFPGGKFDNKPVENHLNATLMEAFEFLLMFSMIPHRN